ncbi:hypothetical protein [Sporosarcina sp. OR05]|uniref:hypothetical protein n=1 Tax=Sporosarcina sp. OR05 TaxID=2969819 RepID=UPI00352B1C2E
MLVNKQYGDIQVDFELEIQIPVEYPNSLPKVFETSNKVERIPENHVNYDGSLCLGAPIRLKMTMRKNPSLIYFFENCILPYLYAVSLKIYKGESFVFGELAHGKLGLIEDFKNLFNLSEEKKVYHMLFLLGTSKREANRLLCPCGCKKRVSTCRFFKNVQQMRKLLPRSEWEEQYTLIKRGY